MTVQESNTLQTICELERNQLLTILAMSVQNPQLAGLLLTGNRSNFLYVEGSTSIRYIIESKILMIKIFTFFDLNLLNANLH